MVQGISAGTLATFTHGGLFGSIPVWRRDFRLMRDTDVGFRVARQNLRRNFGQILPFIGQFETQESRNVRVNARWPFKGHNQGLDASSEGSESTNEDILMFFFQLDLGTRVQVCHLIFLVSALFLLRNHMKIKL